MSVFANSTGPSTVQNAFYIYARDVHRLALASPFFSYSDLLRELATADRVIDLIVRLGAATSPGELRKAMALPNVRVRFFTSSLFHSKLYVFGDRCALVGSANFTLSGMRSNREITITVLREHPDFDELVTLFEAYWAEANVLDEPRLKKYEKIWSSTQIKSTEIELDNKVRDAFGDISPSQGIQIRKTETSPEKTYLEDYRRTYQEFLSAFREVQDVYKEDGRRQQPNLPLRIEIDQFFSYIREVHAPGESFLQAPLRVGSERREFLRDKITAWFGQRWKWLDTHIVDVFPLIQSRFGTPSSIKAASMDELIDALEVCHAFTELLRFHLGGAPTVRKEFAEANDINRVKHSISYLLHGKGEFIDRMGTVIFDPTYKLAKMGRSVVQELLGWVNREDIPICNGRTIKALRYLGFGLSE